MDVSNMQENLNPVVSEEVSPVHSLSVL